MSLVRPIFDERGEIGELLPAPDGGLQSDVLEDLAEAANYRRWLGGLARPWLGDDPLEIGSGLGDHAAEWVDSVGRFTVSEASPVRLEVLRRRFADDGRVTVRELEVPGTGSGSHSAVVAYNVLEHIADDVAALRTFANLLSPDGHLVLLVPAFPAAMSRFDRMIGHHRRYTRHSVGQLLAAAGMRPVVLHYVNAPGLLAWFVGMRMLGMRPRAGPLLRRWDALVPTFAGLEHRRTPPFGQSLFVVAAHGDGQQSAD